MLIFHLGHTCEHMAAGMVEGGSGGTRGGGTQVPEGSFRGSDQRGLQRGDMFELVLEG